MKLDGENLIARLGDRLAGIRGRLTPNAAMEKITWFRAGGAAEVLCQPADEEDLSAFLKAGPREIPLTVGVTEPTGAETHVVGTLGGADIPGVFRDRVTARPGETLGIRIDGAAAHLFDAEGGARLSG